MLGGYERVSRVDIQGSKNLLANLRLKTMTSPACWKIADCGAGIGRVTKGLLSTLNSGATLVDIVEPVKKFTQEALEGPTLKPEREAGKIGKVFNMGLEEWDPVAASAEAGEKYFIIWT